MEFKKWVSFFLILGILMASMVTGYAATGIQVEKVVFRNMETSKSFVGLGGVRFYNAGNMIESGAVITSSGLNAETDSFTISVSSRYGTTPDYRPVNTVDTSSPQVGLAGDQCFWISENGGTSNQTYTINFKTPEVIDTLEFVTSFQNTSVATDGPFIIDVYATDGTMTSHDIIPTTVIDDVQSLSLGGSSSLTLDVQALTYDLNAGDTVDVDVMLSNATDIFAEDFIVQYDTAAFELISEVVSDATAYQMFHTDKSTAGQARYIIASNGASYGITGESGLLKMTFKAKNFDGESEIKVLSGLVADSQGVELTPDCLGKIFTLTGGVTDVNGDDNFTLGDLAIASNLLAMDSSSWGTFTPDVDTNGAVETADLSLIVTNILN